MTDKQMDKLRARVADIERVIIGGTLVALAFAAALVAWVAALTP